MSRSALSLRAVSMITGTVEKLRISWQACRPSFFGIIRSRMIRS